MIAGKSGPSLKILVPPDNNLASCNGLTVLQNRMYKVCSESPAQVIVSQRRSPSRPEAWPIALVIMYVEVRDVKSLQRDNQGPYCIANQDLI